ncbi:hypothetical protein [Acidicapsa acidisoli]|uniref:hypothetical protein n=1 Tax=Acidicapsa acidisoli TaxID=1615681 RepID=UPI0021E0C377|nr:hypothetical protein [Acidicapsa acidisoli]
MSQIKHLLFLAIAFSLCNPGVAQTGPPHTVPKTPLPIKKPVGRPTPSCNTGPWPSTTFSSHGNEVHFWWDPVPGAVSYIIDRAAPNQTPVRLTLDASGVGVWDVPPDPSVAYKYSVTAMQPPANGKAIGCHGTTSYLLGPFTLANPSGQATRGNDPTSATVSWAPATAVIAYVVWGSGLPNVGETFTVGTYTPQNGYSSIASPMDPALHQGTLGWSIDVTGLNPNVFNWWKILAIYANGYADQQHPGFAGLDAIPHCTITSISPTSGPVDTKVTLTGTNLVWVTRVGQYSTDRGGGPDADPILSPAEWTSVSPTLLTATALVSGTFNVSQVNSVCGETTPFVLTTQPPPPTPQVGALTVSFGFTAGQGETCQGGPVGVAVQPQHVSGNVGTTALQSQLSFSGLASPVTVSGQQTSGCIATHLFGNMAPGTWTVTAGIPGGAAASCAVAISANQFAKTLIWDLKCF